MSTTTVVPTAVRTVSGAAPVTVAPIRTAPTTPTYVQAPYPASTAAAQERYYSSDSGDCENPRSLTTAIVLISIISFIIIVLLLLWLLVKKKKTKTTV